MKKIILLVLISSIFFSCSNDTPSAISGLLNEKNLRSQFFNINIDTDTTLLTKNGCVIKIPKGAITSSSQTVKLEIKEALSNTAIVMAGLRTSSGKQALSSGYFNAASGYNIEIKKQIEVLVPTVNYNRDMQVFTGDTVNGKIDWTLSEPLPQDSTTLKVDTGKALFLANCASCHKVYKDFTGPALYGITDRLPWEWVYALTVHDRRILDGGCIEGGADASWELITDTGHLGYWEHYTNSHEIKMPEVVKACLYHKCIRSKFGSEMTSFPLLAQSDVINIYAYIKSESDKRPELKEKFAYNCCDSCVEYVQASLGLLTQREKLKEENGNFFNLDRVVTIPQAATEMAEADTVDMPAYTKVTPTQVKATYYTINIKAVGWYNIDVMMKNYKDCVESELFVRLQGSYQLDININLIIPQYKVFVEGGKLDDEKQYGFDETSGKIMLPQNTKAYIIAFAEKEDKIIFAKKEFNTQTKQTIDLVFTEISNQQLQAEIKSLKLDDVKTEIKDSKNAEEIRAIDKQLKNTVKLKPKNCDCDDLLPGTAPMPVK